MVVGNLLWFVTKVLIVRNITVEELGLYSLAITIVSVLAALAALGTHEGTARNISTLLGKGRTEDADSVARAALHINLVSSTIICILLFLLAGVLSRHVFYKPEVAVLLRIISVVIPFTAMTVSIGAMLRGHQNVTHKVYYIDIGHPLYLLFFLGIMLLSGLTLAKLVYAYMLSAALVFVSIASYGYKKLGIPPLPFQKGYHYRELLMFSLPLLVAGISGLVLNWTDTLMLGRYTPPESVGIYNISITLARLMTFILLAMGFVFFPMATEMHAKNQTVELQRTYQVLTKWVFAASFPLFFVLFFFPEMTITFLFGNEFVEASVPLRILSFGFLFHVFLGANGILLTAMGMTKTIMKISLSGAALNIILNYILIKRFGMGVNGASIATLVSYVLINTLISMVLYRSSGIHPFSLRYIKPIIGASVIAFFIYGLVKNVFFAWWMMPVYLAIFIVGYGASLLLSRSIEKEDMLFFEGIEKRLGIEMQWLRKLINRFTPSD